MPPAACPGARCRCRGAAAGDQHEHEHRRESIRLSLCRSAPCLRLSRAGGLPMRRNVLPRARRRGCSSACGGVRSERRLA
jgi:hypothetical protein